MEEDAASSSAGSDFSEVEWEEVEFVEPHEDDTVGNDADNSVDTEGKSSADEDNIGKEALSENRGEQCTAILYGSRLSLFQSTQPLPV